VVRYVAENSKELVVECAGWNLAGDQIVRYLVVDKLRVQQIDMVLVDFGGFTIYNRLPAALPFGMYLPRWYQGNDLPLPYPPCLHRSSLSSSSVSHFTPDNISDCHSSFWSILCMV